MVFLTVGFDLFVYQSSRKCLNGENRDTYLVGTTFDQGRGLYWMLHNMHSSGERLESYLTSVNVNTGEFYYLEYPLGVLSVWDIDLDSLGNIQFLARSSLPRDGRSLVDYMAFDPHFNKTIMLRSSAIVLPSFGSVAVSEIHSFGLNLS